MRAKRLTPMALAFRLCLCLCVTYEFAGWRWESQYVLEREPSYTAGLDDRKVLVVAGQITVFVDTGQWRHRVDCQRNRRHNDKQHRYDRQHLSANRPIHPLMGTGNYSAMSNLGLVGAATCPGPSSLYQM